MSPKFPVPRITESFVDGVIEELGWKRYTEIRVPVSGEHNADYVAPSAILELKIFEEEGLEKKQRQEKIAQLYQSISYGVNLIDIDLDNAPEEIKRELERIIDRPLQNAIKKASKQISDSLCRLEMNGLGVLLAVNNGYSYLNSENFERLIARRCKNDTNRIDYAVCITLNYYQGFDAIIVCKVNILPIKAGKEWSGGDVLRQVFQKRFCELHTEMMRDMYSEVEKNLLNPVADILFEKDGVRYVRKAPEVPDSRFF